MANNNGIPKQTPFETWYEETYGKWVCDDNEQLVYVKASQHPDDIELGKREYDVIGFFSQFFGGFITGSGKI